MVPYFDYNIPSNNRELQRRHKRQVCDNYYNIPSNNRELQPFGYTNTPAGHYNIPSNNRELQPQFQLGHLIKIITYQVITGNYSIIHIL